MRIGVPQEIKTHEYRVGLTPDSAAEYIKRGHSVLLQTGAGIGIGKSDDDYRALGVDIAPNAQSVFDQSDLIIKVKEPQRSEYTKLREGQILFTYLHLAPDLPQTEGLLQSGVTSIAYETVTSSSGDLPLLAPMSEIAGRLAAEALATALTKNHGGCGVLMGGITGVAPANVLILGGGIVGTQAAAVCLGMGARVTIFDLSLPRLRQLANQFGTAITTQYSTTNALEQALTQAHGVIGAALTPGGRAPRLLTRNQLQLMQSGSVLVDVAIDQGGCFETSSPTTHDNPTYIIDDVVHYCVSNMPGIVPRTASEALNHATLPFGLALADQGLDALRSNPHLRAGLHTHKGKLVNNPVAQSHNLEFTDPLTVLEA